MSVFLHFLGSSFYPFVYACTNFFLRVTGFSWPWRPLMISVPRTVSHATERSLLLRGKLSAGDLPIFTFHYSSDYFFTNILNCLPLVKSLGYFFNLFIFYIYYFIWGIQCVLTYLGWVIVSHACGQGHPTPKCFQALRQKWPRAIIGWFSNRTRTSVDDGARKLTTGLTNGRAALELGTGSRV